MNIAVAGMGYVGLANAVMLSEKHNVTITDIDENKVAMLKHKTSPIQDTELQQRLRHSNLNAVLAAQCDYSKFDYVVVAVPTDFDSAKDSFNTSSVETVIEQTLTLVQNTVVVIRSTVPIGFTRRMCEHYKTDRIIFAPEFLREGKALLDSLNPSRIIVGGVSNYAESFSKLLADAAEKTNISILITDSAEAEAIKLFSNAYLAMRVAFFNEVDTFAMSESLNSKKVIDGVCLDPRIGDGYNNPSFGYGGYCLPKDTKQLKSTFSNISSHVIKAIVNANQSRNQYIADRLISGNYGIVGIYRLTMKEGSDNLRESTSIELLRKLKSANQRVIIYEPILNVDVFEGCEVYSDLTEFKCVSDIIVANRWSNELLDVADRVFTRDIYNVN